jgi:hypothetical protein
MRRTVTRIGAVAAMLAIAATANAQSFAFARTAFGQVDASRFATTTQQQLAIGDPLVIAPSLLVESAKTDDLHAKPSSDVVWTSVLAASDEDEQAEKEKESIGTEGGFFSSTMGRASIVGLAGLAGASYFALRGGNEVSLDTRAPDASSLPGTPPSAEVLVNPEPGTWALMLTGLAGMAVVRRRRKA